MAGKADIVDQIADSVEGVNKRQAGEAFDAVFQAITDSLKGGDKVSISGFGTFSVSHRKEREGRNPATGATITIAASNNAKFKSGAELKRALN